MITLQFSTRRGLTSKFIRWFTWSDFSHVEFVLETEEEELLLGASAFGGVQWRSLKDELPFYTRYARFIIPDCPATAIAAAETQLYKPYDFSALFGFLFRRDWAEKDSWFCSELVYWAFVQVGYKPFGSLARINRITPQHILMISGLQLVEEFGR